MTDYRRNHPRVPAAVRVELTTPGREVIHVHTVNVSPAGIQLTCDGATVDRILPISQSPAPSGSREFDARLHLPQGAGAPYVLETRCAAIFSRRVAANDYRVGLQFLSLREVDERGLERFLEDPYSAVD